MNCYPINGLFFYRLIFMFILILGESIFCYKLKRKKHFVLKLIGGILACFAFAAAFPIPTSNDFYSMFMFFIMFIFTYFVAFFLFDVKFDMLFFCLICGYTTEHIAYETYNLMKYIFIAGDVRFDGLYNYNTIDLFANRYDFGLWLVAFINIYWITLLLFGSKIQKGLMFEAKEGTRALLIGCFFILIDIVINSAVNYYSKIHYERVFMAFIAGLNLVCCGIGIFFIFELYYKDNLKKDYDIIQELRKEEKSQYVIAKDTIEMINIKCHDFRHQIRKLGQEQNIDINTITNVNKLINIYDASIKTTNDALTVILSEKSISCLKNSIHFEPIVNGDYINFMSDEDIYSLFGNILDNAIEASKTVDENRRVISLRIKKIGNMVSVSARNEYSNLFDVVDGIPASTKKDKKNHGYGLKSIKLITEKYNGVFNIDYNEHSFTITLLFTVA